MKRSLSWMVLAAAVLLVTGLLGGCDFLPNGIGIGSSTVTAPVKVGVPAVGSQFLGTFIPLTATTFFDGVVGVGEQNTDASGTYTLPAVIRPLSGAAWQAERIGALFRFTSGAAEIGTTRVVAGTEANDPIPGKDSVPFAAVSENGSAYTVALNGLASGRSAAFNGIGTTGDPRDASSKFIIVGGIESQNGVLLGNPSGTDPFVYLSDDGKAWQPSGPLTLPSGVKSAEAWAVTFAPNGSAYPGILVVGQGWADVGKDNILGRHIGIVWQSKDLGKSWKIVSDDNFNETGRDMEPRNVAASGSAIVVAGRADVLGQVGRASPKQAESVEWVAGRDGTWHVISDGKSLRKTRSSMVTALVARQGAGFIEASEIYDTASGPFYAGSRVRSNPVVRLFATVDGLAWNSLTESIPGMDTGAIVDGIAEYGNRDVFFGIDQQGHSKAYVVDRASVK